MIEILKKCEERLNILVPNPDLEKEFEELRELRLKYQELESKLIEQKKISGYQAVSNWVPSGRTQQLRIGLINQKLLGPALGKLAAQIDAQPDWAEATRSHLQQYGSELTVEQFLASPASEPWRHLWLGKTADGYASIVALRGLAQSDLTLVRQAADGQAGRGRIGQAAGQ